MTDPEIANRVAIVTHNGERIRLPQVDDLTLGELELLDVEGYDVEKLDDLSKTRATIAMTWIALRRHDSTISLDDVRNISIKAVDVETLPKAPADRKRSVKAVAKKAPSRAGTVRAASTRTRRGHTSESRGTSGVS